MGEEALKKAKENKGKLEIFYVVYILSAGLIDDLSDLLNSIDPSLS